MITVNIAKDFTRFPAGRYKSFGETSGEAFRQKFLEEPIKHGDTILVEFDGTLGYGSSFLEEAFGGIVRSLKISSDKLLKLLQFKSSDPTICTEVQEYIIEASRKLK